jgi:hypothetical protein
MVRHWENSIEAVAGGRANREEPWALRTCRRIFYCLVTTLSEFGMPDNVCDFRLIDRKVWGVVVSHDDRYPYIRGIIDSAGFRLLILPLCLAAPQTRHFKEQRAAVDRSGDERHFQRAHAVQQSWDSALRSRPFCTRSGSIQPISLWTRCTLGAAALTQNR